MTHAFRLLLCSLLALPGLVWLNVAVAAAPLILAVHPYLAVGEIEKRFEPLARHLGAAIGRDVVIRVPHDYDEHIKIIGMDKADIAFVGPASLIAVEQKYSAKALLGRLEVGGRSELYGHIIVRSDSPLKTLADLRGQRVALGDPHSTMSFLVPRAFLQAAGISERDVVMTASVGNHDNIALAVLTGEYAAGAVKDETFGKYAARGLRSLAELPHVSDHAFIASSRLPPEIVERLRRALFVLRDSDTGRAILKNIQPNLTAIIPAQSGDYDNLRNLLFPQKQPAKARRP